jgi:hypothetical protein
MKYIHLISPPKDSLRKNNLFTNIYRKIIPMKKLQHVCNVIALLTSFILNFSWSIDTCLPNPPIFFGQQERGE